MAENNGELLPGTSFPYDSSNVLLGKGGSGAVFLAKHHETMELIAVKRCYRRNIHIENRTSNGKRFTRPLISSADGTTDGYRTESGSYLLGQRFLERNAIENEEDMREESNMEALTLSQQGESPSRCVNTQRNEYSRQYPEGTKTVAEVNEVAILETLSPHPHIVRYLGRHTSSRNVTFFAMELMNSDIAREVSQGSRAFMREDVCTVLIFSILLALHHLHSNGIVHRDVKPGNILLKRVSVKKMPEALPILLSGVAPNGEARVQESGDDLAWVRATLGDFSAAHFSAQTEIDPDILVTRGTLHYKAPEQLMGKPIASFSPCDMWALGCTIYELYTGKLAFPGSSGLQVQLQIFKQMGSSFSKFPAQDSNPALFDKIQASSDFVNLLQKLLVLDPARRLSAHEALQHPLFAGINALLKLKMMSNATKGATFISFPLKLLYSQLPDLNTFKVRFRPVAWTPHKRQRAKVGFTARESLPQIRAPVDLTPVEESGNKHQSWEITSNISDANSLHWSQVRPHPNHTPAVSVEPKREEHRTSGSPEMHFPMTLESGSEVHEGSHRVSRCLSVLTKSLRSSPQKGVMCVDGSHTEAPQGISFEVTPMPSSLDATTKQIRRRGMMMTFGTSLIAGNQRTTQEFEFITRQSYSSFYRVSGDASTSRLPRMSFSSSIRNNASLDKLSSPPLARQCTRRCTISQSRSPEPNARKALCFESPRFASESTEQTLENVDGSAVPTIPLAEEAASALFGHRPRLSTALLSSPGRLTLSCPGLGEPMSGGVPSPLADARTPSRLSDCASSCFTATCSPIAFCKEMPPSTRGPAVDVFMPPPLPLTLPQGLARGHGAPPLRIPSRPQRHCTPSADPHDGNAPASVSEPRGRSRSTPSVVLTESHLAGLAEGVTKRVRLEPCS
ncbi:unnamed protein product [Phytomonas sp. EM1]|nr:unnamed protein product [Phytomonas sp. EM1]|eukprot:CCW62502.1 unnamed protein product [Phytomonas sp. isolate EM1]